MAHKYIVSVELFFLASLFLLWTPHSLAAQVESGPLCSSSRCFEMLISNETGVPISTTVIPGSCYEGDRSGMTISANSMRIMELARVQGHGCDGENGNFLLQIGNGFGRFSFTNDAWLNFEAVNIGANLSPRFRAGQTFYYKLRVRTIAGPFTHSSGPSPTGWGNWAAPSQNIFKISTAGFLPNHYDSILGWEVYHPQHVLRLPNDGNGNAYFMITQSHQHAGYISLIRVEANKVAKDDRIIIGPQSDVVGKIIWQQHFAALPTNWNHPCKMAYLDGLLVVAAQNWYTPVAPGGAGFSDDAILFYDVRESGKPVLIATMPGYGVPKGDLSIVDLAYNESSKKYLLTVGGGGHNSILTNSELMSYNSNWVNAASWSFSGQHGSTFNIEVDGTKQLVYFDVSKEDGKLEFVSYNYTTQPPYLSVNKHEVFHPNLDGANRDWDAASIYFTAGQKAPIIYTVKSIAGDEYQIYQMTETTR